MAKSFGTYLNGRIRGKFSEIIAEENAYNAEVAQARAREEEIHGEERIKRKNYNERITEMITKGFPDEEIIIAIKKEFSEMSETEIKNRINH